MKKRLLFITYDLGYAGTNSALSSIYNSLNGSFDISIFPLINSGAGVYAFTQSVRKGNFFTNLVYAHFEELSFFEKLCACILKPLLRFAKYFGFDLIEFILAKTARKIEAQDCYDFVVGFQEGRVTKFASFFHCENKIAWLHCDYRRAYSDLLDEINIYNSFSKIVCVSDYTRTSFVARYPALNEKTIFIYNILDTDRIVYLSKDKFLDKTFHNSLFTILSVGRLCDVKRFELIPQIASRLKKLGFEFNWYIIGDGEKYNNIKKSIEDSQVENNVFLLGKKVNPYPYFVKSNLLVSTSSSEACPMIFNEAKILGIPIVSADFPTASEFIQNGINGIVCSIEQMTFEISQLISNPKLYESIKQKSLLDKSYNAGIYKQLISLFK